jgi:HD superfamily phosphohydrolase
MAWSLFCLFSTKCYYLSMIIKDRVYGTHKITSPVLQELIKTSQMQRLKGINQSGVPSEFFYTKNYSRYEHSLGVLILLIKFGASEEEQVAGLLHDVSHTAFSHVIDWVVGNFANESFQDDNLERILKTPEINNILKKYKYDYKRISKLESYSLLDNEIPNLCADRLDYSLRQMPQAKAKKLVKEIKVVKGKVVFKNRKSAKEFALEFLRLQSTVWGGYESAVRYKLLANLIKEGLETKIITMDDLWTDDKKVISKLNKRKNEKMKQILKLLKTKSLKHLEPKNDVIYKKFRHVDPLYTNAKGVVVRLSSNDVGFKRQLQKAKAENKQGVKIPKFMI